MVVAPGQRRSLSVVTWLVLFSFVEMLRITELVRETSLSCSFFSCNRIFEFKGRMHVKIKNIDIIKNEIVMMWLCCCAYKL